MRYTATPADRVTLAIADLTGATLAGFAIAHVVIAVRTGFTGYTIAALAIVAALLATVALIAQPRWIELDGRTLVRGLGPLRIRRRLAAIYFAGIERDGRGHHLAVCLRGGERLRIGRGLAYPDLHRLRQAISRTASARDYPSATPARAR